MNIPLPNRPKSAHSLRAFAVLTLLLFLAGCSAEYQHVFVTPRGPGSVTIAHAHGETFCRVFDKGAIEHCRHYAKTGSQVITVTALPDEGHEFVGWSPRHPTSWNSDLDANTNPLELKIDSSYLFYANFK